ncbi:MAG: hypothetical protein JSV26_04405 [bacterium]|nr:MAG: hypothetical protein JSV26_04405 [bacterium]
MIRTASGLFAILLLVMAPPGHAGSEREISIRADTLQIEEARGEIRFEGGVTLEYGDVEMSCNTLILFTEGGGTGEVVRGQAMGDVRLTRLEDRLEAGSAYFDIKRGVVELEDSPHLTRGGSRISAARIAYQVDNGLARFEGPVKAKILPGGDEP